MILADSLIKQARRDGSIVVDPWDEDCLGPNSYDVHLSKTLVAYAHRRLIPMDGPDTAEYYVDERESEELWQHGTPINAAVPNPTIERIIGPNGYVLRPGRLYLASTIEYTESHEYLPYLDGKSSVGRLGIRIHATAGRGDVGFCGHWTMELDVVQPVRIYAGMPIGQLTWHSVHGTIERPYGGTANRGNYSNEDPKPQPSRMWKHFPLKERK